MYLPTHFTETRPELLHALMREHPLATLVVPTAAGLVANPLPLMLRESGDGLKLVGHVARANDVWRQPPAGEALAVFTAAQGYVSPAWYPSKAEHGKVVPTWNYATVHAHGTLRWIDDTAWLHELVSALTDRHEALRAKPWHVSDAPDDYVQQMLRAIVGLELTVTRLEGKFKLSQNRAAADREGVVQGLSAQGDAVLATAVREGK
jgi:transcriptional regulator